MSLRSGKGSITTKPSKAALRAMGRRGNETQSAQAQDRNKVYTDTVPF